MKNKLITGLVLGLMLLCAPSSAVDVLFFEGSLLQVEQQAAREGKLYFVDFYARWCLPCKWMDETTFTDPDVAQYLQENYVPAKVNIDNFDGFGYKEKYNVHVLPTFIIFNSAGEIVGRHEESLPPSKMLAILQQYDIPENRVKFDVPEPIVQKVVEEAPDYDWNDEIYRVPTEEATTAVTDNESKADAPEEQETAAIITAETAPEVPVNTPEPIEEVIVDKSEIIREDIGLFNFSVSTKSRSGFAVQVGVFAEYSNVLTEAERFQQKYGGETIVHIEKVNGEDVYKLMLGSYDDRSDAQAFLNQIVEEGGDALLKDLSVL